MFGYPDVNTITQWDWNNYIPLQNRRERHRGSVDNRGRWRWQLTWKSVSESQDKRWALTKSSRSMAVELERRYLYNLSPGIQVGLSLENWIDLAHMRL